VRTTSTKATAGSLSGGNQQKVVLARELSRPLKLLIASQPTRGLDVGSIEFVHKRIIAERDRGAAVLIVSSELDEVVALADRIAVMYHGRIVGIVPPDTDRQVLGLMRAGADMEEVA
jgi:simple sugar transport system ATP-binding protein